MLNYRDGAVTQRPYRALQALSSGSNSTLRTGPCYTASPLFSDLQSLSYWRVTKVKSYHIVHLRGIFWRRGTAMLATSNGCPEKNFSGCLVGLIPLIIGPLGLSRLVVVIFFFLGVIFFLGGASASWWSSFFGFSGGSSFRWLPVGASGSGSSSDSWRGC